ncbi:MAG: tol-pal system-associated acyl-CoA thioesterase [Methylohalobius sp.]|nr:tol-pal system-associated acyl-CoA thioesterase [Methylohalobius sp.]
MGDAKSRFDWPVRIYYEDTDAGGVVYYANYLKFFERARTEFLRALGFEQDQLKAQEGIIFAVRSVRVEYIKPARFNDLLVITCSPSACRHASLDFFQQIFLRGETLLCQGWFCIACLDAVSLRPRPIPESLRKVLHE